MGYILKWWFWITFAVVLFIGLGSAWAITRTIADTGGKTGGLMIHGVPTLVQGFQQGLKAGGGTGSQSSWNGAGVDQNWTGQSPAPRKKAPAKKPAHKAAPKPNV